MRAPVVPSTHVRAAVCAAVRRVTSPRLILLSSSHCRLGSLRAETGDADRAPSRESVVEPTERRRLHRACAGRTADARARRHVRRRASGDITASHPALLVALPARLSQSRDRRRRSSAEPRGVVEPTERRRLPRACAGRTADARARRRVRRRASVTSPRLILLSSSHCRLGSLRAETGDADRAPSRESVVEPTERRRLHRACAGRTADVHARRAPPCVG